MCLKDNVVSASPEEQASGGSEGNEEDVKKEKILDSKMCPDSQDEVHSKQIYHGENPPPGDTSTYLGIFVRNLSTTASATTLNFFYVDRCTTVKDFLEQVGKTFKYEPGTFSLIYFIKEKEARGEELDLNAQLPTARMDSFGFNPERTSLVLINLCTGPPKRVDDDDLSLGASASPTSSSRIWVGGETEDATINVNLDACYSSRSGSEIGYVGLVNQAMTCYLNSLLQTLFMTPEFRNALYKWQFVGNEEEAKKNIPFQLQKLFLQLQTASRSVETTNLTKSFGWDSSEAWQQHDIQELCRVMFDALEMCLKNTEQSDLISNLYEGKMKDYVKCLSCDTEGAREDTFLDIPLPIRPFGSTTAFKSVEDAIRAFIEPEILSDNNQYFCSKCNKLSDAHKGLKFAQFPYLLTLHLKRFDFDYATLHRIKLNDRVTFPGCLNLNGFCESASKQEIETESFLSPDKVVLERQDDCSTADSGSSALDGEDSIPEIQKDNTSNGSQAISQDEDEGIDCSSLSLTSSEKDRLSSSSPSSPYFYELFSIMIHSGSASGGHYYAYIKDFRTGEWFCFNDQNVTRITLEDIEKTYGGASSSGGYYSNYTSSANAYMLMYRQINKERNVVTFRKDDLPPHISNLLTKMCSEEAAEKEQREIERCLCKLKVFCHIPKLQSDTVSMKRIKIHKDFPLKKATEMVYNEFELDGVVPLERCRLVKYEECNDNIEASFDNSSDDSISEVLGGVRSTYKFDLMLEIIEEGREFEQYLPGGICVKVYLVNLKSEEVEGPHSIRTSSNQTVGEFRNTIARILSLEAEKMRLVTMFGCYYNEMNPLTDFTRTLEMESLHRSNKVYVESSGIEAPDFFVGSQMYSILDRFENTIVILCELPQIDNDILKELQIPAFFNSSSCPSSITAGASSPSDNNIDAINNKKNADVSTSIKKEVESVVSPQAVKVKSSSSNMNALDDFDDDISIPQHKVDSIPVEEKESVKCEVKDEPLEFSGDVVIDNKEGVVNGKESAQESESNVGREIKITKKKKKDLIKVSLKSPKVKAEKVEKCEVVVIEKEEEEKEKPSDDVKEDPKKKEKASDDVKEDPKKKEKEEEGKVIPITTTPSDSSPEKIKESPKLKSIKLGPKPIRATYGGKVNKISIASVFNQSSSTTVNSSSTSKVSVVSSSKSSVISSREKIEKLELKTTTSDTVNADANVTAKSSKKINISSERTIRRIPKANVETSNSSISSSIVVNSSISNKELLNLSSHESELGKNSRSPSPRLLPTSISYTIPQNITSTVNLSKDAGGAVTTTTTTTCKSEPSTVPLKDKHSVSESCVPTTSNTSVSYSPAVSVSSITTMLDPPSPTPPAQLSDDEDMVSEQNEMECAVTSHVSSDQSASEESSLTSDSDRTLVGDPPDDQFSPRSNSPDYRNISSPEESYGEPVNTSYYWDISAAPSQNWSGNDDEKEVKRYFRAKPGSLPKVLEILVDRRITIGQLRKELEKYVGVSEEHFKLFKYNVTSKHEFEYTRMKETLTSTTFGESSILKILLGRALLPGEYKGKIYFLDVNNSEDPAKFMIDFVISQGDSVQKVKTAVIREVNTRYRMDLIESDVRLRKKSWKNPLTIYMDQDIFDRDITLYANWELYLQIFSGPETKTNNIDELSLFIKRWRPSSYSTEALLEIIIYKHTIEALKQKICELSGIIVENIEIAKGKGCFPCDMSVLDIATDLDWTQKNGELDQRPLFILDDGAVIYYKDKMESLKNLSEVERGDLATGENTRLNRELPYTPQVPSSASSSHGKEKGLKIYLNPPPSSK